MYAYRSHCVDGEGVITYSSFFSLRMSVNYASRLSDYDYKGKCGLPEVSLIFLGGFFS